METTFQFQSSQGLQLACYRVQPPRARAQVVFLHGWGDHAGRYREMAHYLATLGIASWLPDMAGHGRSPGPRAQVHDFQTLIDDLSLLLLQLPAEVRPFLCGQSMGGCLAAHYAARFPDRVSGVIFMSAALGVNRKVSSWRRQLALALGGLFPGLKVGYLKQPAMMSTLADAQRAYARDKQVYHGKIDAGTARALLLANARVRECARGFSVPFLALQGTDDSLVDVAGPQHFRALARTRDAQLRYFDNARHELFIDFVKDEVYELLSGWMLARISLG